MTSTIRRDFEVVFVVCESIIFVVCEGIIFVVYEIIVLVVCESIVFVVYEIIVLVVCESIIFVIVLFCIVALVVKPLIAFVVLALAALISDVFLFLGTERVVDFPLCRITPPIRRIYWILYASIVSVKAQKNTHMTHLNSFYWSCYKTNDFASPFIKTEAPNWSQRSRRLVLAMPSFARLFMVNPMIVRWRIHEAVVDIPLRRIALGNGFSYLFHRASKPAIKAGTINSAPADGAYRSEAKCACTSSWRLVSSSKARSNVLGHGSDSGDVVKSASEKR
jgi:hypothetical protein